MNEHKRIVEINGIKIEVDLRTAKRVDQFKVGDAVKLLKKKYNDSYESHPGAIVGFDEFTKLPTIIVAYIESDYSSSSLKFQYINEKTTDCEIAPMQEFERSFSLHNMVEKFDLDIEKTKKTLVDLETKKEWFVNSYKKYFGKIFSDVEVEVNKEE